MYEKLEFSINPHTNRAQTVFYSALSHPLGTIQYVSELSDWQIPPQSNPPAILEINHVELLKCGSDVMWTHARGSAHSPDADTLIWVVVQVLQYDTFPISQVGQTTQIR